MKTFPASDTQIKIFQIKNSTDETTLNEFLVGKLVRHWEATFTPSASVPGTDAPSAPMGTWNIFVAYEIRQSDGKFALKEQRMTGPSSGRKNVPSGRAAQASAMKQSEKAAINEEYKPNVADSDFPLFDAVRKWRNSRAREERVKPFTFFNNRQLEQIVTLKPATIEALRSIAVDMEPALWEKYQNELLAFIETARSANGSAEAITAEPAATLEPVQ